MKTLATIAIYYLFAAMTSQAGLREKLTGTWSGTASVNANGKIVNEKISIVFKLYEKNGIVATTTIKIAGRPTSVGVARYHENGKVEGEMKQNGSVVAVISGTWQASNKFIKSSVKASGIFPSFRTTGKTTLETNNRISSVGTSSNGSLSVASLTRQ